ncbi:MAG: CDGSH iron-sulfur domain-containing protein [Bacteroidales bacterium]|nr:CDGSH iron-sulfur domain-containing protein [Bacteroidales bacterium]MBN2750641.1 CDGSH iron-sulfur domain-containing protein [Bacteroidales bacterium]
MSEKNSISAEIKLVKGGPIKITGNIILTKSDGTPIPAPAGDVYICACGRSKQKPFCDGSHKQVVMGRPLL